jgi:serine protease AprX
LKKGVVSLLALVTLLTLLLSLVIPPAETGNAALLPEVDPILKDAARLAGYTSLDNVTAVVTYRSSPGDGDLAVLRSLGLKTLSFKHLPMVVVKGPYAAIQSLFTRSEILSIYYDKPLRYLLNESVPFIGADRVWSDLGYTGKGVTVAVIDSGVDAGNPDLKFGEKTIQNVKLLVGNDIFGGEPVYLENVENTDTSSGHGTHVAGTIAGTGSASSGRYKGVAPDAKLVGISTGEGLSILWALEGFDYVLDKREEFNIRVVSNSWGTTGEYSPNDPVNVASKKAHDAGITVVFAAGNEGPDNNTLNPYSVAPWVIGVAAGTKDGKLADFSSRGVPGDDLLHPTLTAPGVNIVSARSRSGTVMNGLDATDDALLIPPEYLPYYTTASGTSMATPHVSGVAALMLEANPALSPDLVKEVLVQTAKPMEGYGLHEVGAGYIDAYAATLKATRVKPHQRWKDPKTGIEYPTYLETETWSGLVGPGAAEAGVPSSHEYTFDVARGTVNLTVRIDWTSVTSDLDLYVYGPDGRLAGKSAQGLSTHEETVIPKPAPGTYRVKVEGWLTASESYQGKAVHEKILRGY